MKKFVGLFVVLVALVVLVASPSWATRVNSNMIYKKDVTVEGTFTQSGAAVQSGAITQSGAVTQTGDVANSGSLTLTGKVLTAVEAVTTTAEALLVEADCGKTILLNHASTGIDVFLPAPVSGCYLKTVVFVAFSDDHTINTNAGADIMVGHINEIANTSTGVSDTNADILTLVDTAESIGDYCEFISDGTSWYFTCTVGVDGGMTSGTT